MRILQAAAADKRADVIREAQSELQENIRVHGRIAMEAAEELEELTRKPKTPQSPEMMALLEQLRASLADLWNWAERAHSLNHRLGVRRSLAGKGGGLKGGGWLASVKHAPIIMPLGLKVSCLEWGGGWGSKAGELLG